MIHSIIGTVKMDVMIFPGFPWQLLLIFLEYDNDGCRVWEDLMLNRICPGSGPGGRGCS